MRLVSRSCRVGRQSEREVLDRGSPRSLDPAQSGRALRGGRSTGNWVATRPAAQQRLYRRNHPDEPWDDEHGDRRTELVFIGQFDEAALRDSPDCVCTPGAVEDGSIENPFPSEVGGRVVLR
ncbi:hypothetical protein D8S78_07850 [Natrialba swarupiae]|nr:hypothetical protein [Natrialba swarupiae]